MTAQASRVFVGGYLFKNLRYRGPQLTYYTTVFCTYTHRCLIFYSFFLRYYCGTYINKRKQSSKDERVYPNTQHSPRIASANSSA